MSDIPQQEQPAVSPCGGNCAGASTSSRRDFMLKLGLALNVLAGALVSLPLIGYLFSVLIEKMELQWIKLGAVSSFPEGETRLASYQNPYRLSWDGATSDIPCWVRRLTGNKFEVFAINCTHLGCPVRWFSESKLFMCPCHGGVFYQDGEHAAGPPPRGLYKYQIKIEKGDLYVKGGLIPSLSNKV
ncbi:MAG: Rieske (2Fe-2S) protein [Chthoniobacterales bacterium]